jgi:methyl-accepting chemotaxis protein
MMNRNSQPCQDIHKLQEYLDLLQIDTDTKGLLRANKPLLNQIMPKALEQFYDFVSSNPNLRSKIPNMGMVPRLREAQSEHWNTLFNAQFNETYLGRAHNVAAAHQAIKLDVAWYTSSYFMIGLHFVKSIFKHYQDKAHQEKVAGTLNAEALLQDASNSVTSFLKVMFLDTAFTISEFSILGNLQANNKLQELIARLQEIPSETEHIHNSMLSANEEVSNVSKSIRELVECLNHLSENSSKAVNVSSETRKLTDRSQLAMTELIKSANEINSVIEMIRTVADQTNLLALNATIQASRAGDAGRGFQVVANEVKKLSSQSADSTDKIRDKIEEIQGRIEQAHTNMQQIGNLMHNLNMFNETIASAIEQQGMSTQDISFSVERLANTSKEVEHNIQQLSQHTEAMVAWTKQ